MNNLYDDTLNWYRLLWFSSNFTFAEICWDACFFGRNCQCEDKTELVEGSPVVCSFLMNHACHALANCIDFTQPHELSDVWYMKLPAVFLHFSFSRLGGTNMVPLVSHPTEKQHQWLVLVPSFASESPMIGNFILFCKSPLVKLHLSYYKRFPQLNWFQVQPKVT